MLKSIYTKQAQLFILLGGILLFSPVFVLAQANGTTLTNVDLVPTYESISVYAKFAGDDNGNNKAILEYRQEGSTRWIRGMDMTVDRRDSILNSSINPWKNQWRASILLAKPNTGYEVRVTFSDPDGVLNSPITRIVRTWKETDQILSNGRSLFVATTGDDVNGDGSQSNPYASIQRAADETLPGDTVFVRGGEYTPQRAIKIDRSGTTENYIKFQSFGNEEVIIDIANADKCSGRNGKYCSFDIYASFIVVSGFRVEKKVHSGFFSYWSMKGNPGSHHVIIENNIMEIRGDRNIGIRISAGESEPKENRPSQYTIQGNTIFVYEPGGEESRSVGPGIDIEFGGGNFVIRDNRIEYFGTVRSGLHGRDCIVAHPNFVSEAGFWDSDIYNNKCINGTDDGISLDGGSGNVRVWGNYITGTMIGISIAPVIVGPAYIFRNIIKDLQQHWATQCFMFKIGEGGSGHIYIYHNTFSATDRLLSPDGKECKRIDALAHGADPIAKNIFASNNIIEFNGRAVSDKGEKPIMDHNLFYEPNTENWTLSFARWGGRTYGSFESYQSGSGQDQNSFFGQAAFIDRSNGNFLLVEGSLGIDKGAIIQGFNDLDSAWPFLGSAPDIGAFENPESDSNTPPFRFGSSPAGELPVGTTETSIGLLTSKPSTCRYSVNAGINYDSMPNTFQNTGSTVHSSLVTGLQDGRSYTYYVRCKAINPNPDDFLIDFSIRTPDTTLPVITNLREETVTGTSVTVNWETDDSSNATIHYGVSFSLLDNSVLKSSFSNTHSITIPGLFIETVYYYKITSCNQDGFCSSSLIRNFTTKIADPILIEAEDMNLNGYVKDGSTGWIRVDPGNSGIATQPFSGVSINYDIEINAIAEDDGRSTLEFWIGANMIQSFLYPLGSVSRESITLSLNNIRVNNGDEIKLIGFKGFGLGTAHARVDKIVFIPAVKDSITTPTPPPSTFSIGDRVETTQNLNVRSTPSTSGTLLGTQSTGAPGTVMRGPITADTFTWWNIDYDTGVDGWSVEKWLTSSSIQAPLNKLTFTSILSILHIFLDNPGRLTIEGSNFTTTEDFRFRLKDRVTGEVKLLARVRPIDENTILIDFKTQDLTPLEPGFYIMELERESDLDRIIHTKQLLLTRLGDLWSPQATQTSEQKRDGKINIFDVSRLLSKWGSTNSQDLLEADINAGPNNISAGKIDIFDANRLMANWSF